MKLCAKHQNIIDTKADPEDHLVILSKYAEELDVMSYQEKIEFRKNNCQVCFFGAFGKQKLEKIIKEKNKAKILV